MQMSNICAANVDPNFLSFEFLKCSTLDQGMHQAVADAEWLLALPAPAQSIAGLYSDTRVAIVDALDPSPIVAGLGFSQSLLDLLAVFFFALVFAAAYLRVRDWVQKSSPRLSNMSIIKKSDACFHILFYAVIWVLGLVCIWNDMFNILGDSAWSPIHVSLLWHRYDPSALPLGTRMYYLAQFGFYLQGLLFLLFTTDPKRVDHSVYVTHHLVTLSLIGGSYLLGWTRSGMAIFVIHDLSDIFLHLGKFGKFWRSEWLAGIAWAAFVSSYVLFRLFYYPQIVISVWTDSEIHLRMPPLEHLFFSVALSLLQVLHLVWFGFIVRSVARSIQSGQWTDARGEQDKDA